MNDEDGDDNDDGSDDDEGSDDEGGSDGEGDDNDDSQRKKKKKTKKQAKEAKAAQAPTKPRKLKCSWPCYPLVCGQCKKYELKLCWLCSTLDLYIMNETFTSCQHCHMTICSMYDPLLFFPSLLTPIRFYTYKV